MIPCPKCNGSRINLTQVGTGVGAYVNTSSCSHCDGTGSVDDGRKYYVLWFNRERLRLEMHAAHCAHNLFTKLPQYENVSANWSEYLQETARTIHQQSRPHAVTIEECLGVMA